MRRPRRVRGRRGRRRSRKVRKPPSARTLRRRALQRRRERLALRMAGVVKPILRPSLLAKLEDRMQALMENELKWQ